MFGDNSQSSIILSPDFGCEFLKLLAEMNFESEIKLPAQLRPGKGKSSRHLTNF